MVTMKINIDDIRNVDVKFNKEEVIMKWTSNDYFLSKLCFDVKENNIVEDDDGREIERYSYYSLKKNQFLGMTFKDLWQVKSQLLRFEKNNRKKTV